MKFSVRGVHGEREDHAARVFERMRRGEALADPDLVLVDALVENLDIQACTLRSLVARKTVLADCRFDGAQLRQFVFDEGVVVGGAFDGAALVKSSWYGCALEAVSFRGASLVRAEFDSVGFDAVSFAGASLEGATFSNADLRGVDFAGARFGHTYFFDCLLDEVIAAHAGVVREGEAALEGTPHDFADLFVDRDERFSLGIEKTTGTCFLSFPVRNPYAEYEEYYRIGTRLLARFLAQPALALPFLGACRRRTNDHLLIVQPGRLRGDPA